MLTRSQFDRLAGRQVLKALTPTHSACEAAVDDDETGEARRRRERVQHEADPVPDDVPEVAEADLDKAYSQAYDTPSGYPPLGPVDPERFRRGPVRTGDAAYSPGYEPAGRRVAVPSATPGPGMITRPLLTDGQSRPCAPEVR